MSNFDELTERRGTGSYKWDTPDDPEVLPMWVADMDFMTAPAIIDALHRRVDQGIFGYTKVDADYYSAVVDWFAERHGWPFDPSWIIYTSGVVPAVSAIIKGMTTPGDKVILQTPAYNCFYSSIRNNGCGLSSNKLLVDEYGRYTIDFEDLEHRISDPKARLLILCNPHNPSGRVWTRDELQKVADLCLRNDIFVISDEIHCELTYPGHDYTPYGTLGEKYLRNAAVCISPSKAFNIAGLQIANIVASDEGVRRRIDRAINDNEVCDVNPFGVIATIAAYRKSSSWLDELKDYLFGNIKYAMSELGSKSMCLVTPLEGTYLLWIDIKCTGMTGDEFADFLLKTEKLMVSPGSIYGPGGENYIRLNVACPRRRLEDGISRLLDALRLCGCKA